MWGLLRGAGIQQDLGGTRKSPNPVSCGNRSACSSLAALCLASGVSPVPTQPRTQPQGFPPGSPVNSWQLFFSTSSHSSRGAQTPWASLSLASASSAQRESHHPLGSPHPPPRAALLCGASWRVAGQRQGSLH